MPPWLLLGSVLALVAFLSRAPSSSSQAPGAPPQPIRRPRVAHIGDSLTAYTEKSLHDAYAVEGLDATIHAHGARAILQKLSADTATGKQAAQALSSAQGSTPFDVWVIALGTNDTANVAVGAAYTRAQAIDQMMGVLPAGAPVVWVDTFSQLSTTPYSNANMLAWNAALEAAKARWPNLIVYPWSVVAKTGAAKFSDGLHHTSAGYDVRNRAIAHFIAYFV